MTPPVKGALTGHWRITIIMKNKNIDYYLNLPWTYTIETNFDEKQNRIFIVRVNELPGVYTDAPNINEAMELIKEAMVGTFGLYMKQGEEIPKPLREEDFQGNIAYRTSSRRHFILSREAQRQTTSLSKLLDDCVDTALHRKK